MRLTAEEIGGIKAAVTEVFGPGARVWLFGSRVDDSKRGGDIDLLVEAPEPGMIDRPREAALHDALEGRLGERRIDVLLTAPGVDRGAIERIARRDGVLLEGHWPAPPRRPRGRPEMTPDAAKLLEDVEATGRVAARLRRSLGALAGLLPTTPEAVGSFDADAEQEVDAFLKRFEQLEDMMLRRVARGAFAAAGIDARRFTPRDAMNELEKLEAIGSAAEFWAAHDARNRLAHEYTFDAAAIAARLNAAFAAAGTLSRDWETLAAFARRVARQAGADGEGETP